MSNPPTGKFNTLASPVISESYSLKKLKPEYCKSTNKPLKRNIVFSPTEMQCCFCHNSKIDQENRQHRSMFSQNGLHLIVIFGDYEPKTIHKHCYFNYFL